MPQPVRADIKIKYPKYTGTEPCAQVGLDVFYTDDRMTPMQMKEQQDSLRQVCSSCLMIEECREYAIKHEEFGFWGGMNSKERQAARKKLGIILIKPELVNKDYKGDWKL